MARHRVPALAWGSLLVAGGCGDATAAPTTAATTTTAETTTTSLPAEETTLPADTHPGLNVGWAAVWPADGAEATYRVLWGDDELDMTAPLEYGNEWQGATWDRLILGTPTLGETGMAWYFDRSTPWVLRLAGADAFWVNADGAQLERAVFDNPLVLDLQRLPADRIDLQGTLAIAFDEGEPPSLQLDCTLRVGVVDQDAVTVPAGEVAGVLHIRLTLGAEDSGPASEMWVHPENLLVRWDEAGIFSRLEMVAPWE